MVSETKIITLLDLEITELKIFIEILSSERNTFWRNTWQIKYNRAYTTYADLALGLPIQQSDNGQVLIFWTRKGQNRHITLFIICEIFYFSAVL